MARYKRPCPFPLTLTKSGDFKIAVESSGELGQIILRVQKV